MAKALTGHLRAGFGPDARMASEIVRLRARVRELESELARREPSESSAVGELGAGIESTISDVSELSIRLDRATPVLR